MKLPSHFKNHLLLAALASAYPAISHSGAARVEYASGNVMAVSSAGQRPLARGAELNSGETITTGEGRAQLRFADGALMSLQPQTEFRIDSYHFSGKSDGQEKGFFSLIRGGLRTITGYIGKGNRDNYKVTTSVATIGIRGTEWSGTLRPGASPQDTELNLGTGEGAIEVCNAGGCIVVASGESAVVTGNTAPRRTDVRPNLPPASATNKQREDAVYTPAEDRTEDGELVVVEDNKPTEPSPPPPSPVVIFSAPSYASALIGLQDDGNTRSVASGSAATTFEGAKMTSAGGFSLLGSEVREADYIATTDSSGKEVGVIGWGIWTQGKNQGIPLFDVHYVVGKPVSIDAIAGLQNMRGTYDILKGKTTPSTTLPGAGGSYAINEAKLTAEFGPNTKVSMLLGLTLDGKHSYYGNISGMSYVNGAFSGSTSGGYYTNLETDSSSSATFKVGGIFAGTGAEYAGVTYGFLHDIYATYGSVVLGRSSTVPTIPFQNGGYASALAGRRDDGNGVNTLLYDGSTSTTFKGGYGPLMTAAGNTSLVGTTVSEVGYVADSTSKKGIIGWGRWSAGKYDSVALSDVHYVVGSLTPAADFSSAPLVNMQGSYSLHSSTTPTSTLGNAGNKVDNATLTAYFGPNTRVDLAMGLTAGGRDYSVTAVNMDVDGGKFSSDDGAASYGSNQGTAFIRGFFAGSKAPYAGISYSILDDAKTNGAVVVKQNLLQDGTPFGTQGIFAAQGEGFFEGWNDFDQYTMATLTNVSGGKLVSGTVNGEGTYSFSATNADAVTSVGWIVDTVAGAKKAVLGWGRWTSGAYESGFWGTDLRDVHYVAGQPATNLPTSDVRGSYVLAGGTAPTARDMNDNLSVGRLLSSKLTVDFHANGFDTKADFKVKFGNTVVERTDVGGNGYSDGIFSGSGGTAGNSANYHGILAGNGGKYAGIAYKIEDSNVGVIRGAAGYVRNGDPTPYVRPAQ